MATERINLNLLSDWVHETRWRLKAVEREASDIADFQNQVLRGCVGFGITSKHPDETVDLAGVMEDLRATGEDLFDTLVNMPDAPKTKDGVYVSWARVPTNDVVKALGPDFEPDIEDLPDDEKQAYKKLREDGIGPWQALVLAGEPDPEATMNEVVDMMVSGGLNPDRNYWILFPPEYQTGTNRRPWKPVDAVFALQDNGSISDPVAGEHLGRSFAAHRDSNSWGEPDWRNDDWISKDGVARLAEFVSSSEEGGAAFYGQLDAEDAADIPVMVMDRTGGWVAHSDPFCEPVMVEQIGLFGDGLAHATRANTLSFEFEEMWNADRRDDRRDTKQLTSYLFGGTADFDREFLLDATQYVLDDFEGDIEAHWSHARSGLLDKVAEQELSSDLILQLEEAGDDVLMDLLLRPSRPFRGRGSIAVLRQAGLDPEAASVAIDAVHQATEDHSGWGPRRDNWGEDWAANEAEAFAWLVGGAAQHYNQDNTPVGEGDPAAIAETEKFFEVVEQMFHSGHGEIVYDAAWGELYLTLREPPVGSDSSFTNHQDAADWLGTIELLRQRIYVENNDLAARSLENRQLAYGAVGTTATVVGAGLAIVVPEPGSTVVGVLTLISLATGGASLLDNGNDDAQKWYAQSSFELATHDERVEAAVAMGVIARGDVTHGDDEVVLTIDRFGDAEVLTTDGEPVMVTVLDRAGQPVTERFDVSNVKHREQLNLGNDTLEQAVFDEGAADLRELSGDPVTEFLEDRHQEINGD